jgi:hypothetical protein
MRGMGYMTYVWERETASNKMEGKKNLLCRKRIAGKEVAIAEPYFLLLNVRFFIIGR